MQINHNLECKESMLEYNLELSVLAQNPTYNLWWRLWFRNIVTVLFPFFLLSFLNIQIVTYLQQKKQYEQCYLNEFQRKVNF